MPGCFFTRTVKGEMKPNYTRKNGVLPSHTRIRIISRKCDNKTEKIELCQLAPIKQIPVHNEFEIMR